MEEIMHVRPDAKGRITLGKLAKGVSSYRVHMDGEKIVLDPYAEIPMRERWLFKNPEALASVRRGLEDSAAGRTVSLGDYTQYLSAKDRKALGLKPKKSRKETK